MKLSLMTKSTPRLFILFFLMLPAALAAQELVYESGGKLTPELASFDVTYYNLDVEINPADSTLSGFVDVYFTVVQPTNQIALALDPRLTISSVHKLNNPDIPVPITRTETDRTFYVHFPQTLQPGTKESLRIEYGGKPKIAENPPWDGGVVWVTTPSGEPWVAVANQTIGAWVWWPNKDHVSDKADSVSVNFTMPEELTVASNGRLRGTTNLEGGTKTWHWFVSVPINNYNISFNAAPYETISEPYTSTNGDEFDITFWVLPEFMKEGEELFPQFAEQIRFLEEILGPYPFRTDKYGVAHTPYLGMEHQSIIAYGAGFENGALFGETADFDDLHQHELAHEWWGNLVTVWDWRDFWLHEGFGTYMQPLYAEYLGGKEAYHEMMDLLRTRISEEDAMAVAPRESMSTVEITQGSRGGNIYYKGAWFLHTLRYVIGDDHFFTILRRFAYPTEEMESVTNGDQVRFATTDDFLHLSEEISRMDLDWLFNVYLRKAELPVLHASRRGGLVVLEWRTQNNLPFPMPIEVRVDGQVMTLVPENNRISFELPNQIEVEADPDNWILKKFELAGASNRENENGE
jgi:aminopeptidase N